MRGAIDAIMSRYSVRHFLEENISRADMETIIAAAFAAPSARGAYPVRCVVLTKERMAELAAEVEQKTPFLEGQWAIAVCADTRDYPWGGDGEHANSSLRLGLWGSLVWSLQSCSQRRASPQVFKSS